MSAVARRIVIVGGSSSAWLSAHALAQALRHLAPEITVLDGGADPAAPRAHWALPSQRGAHAQMGISEPAFLRATGSTYRLGNELIGWQGEGSRFLHATGEIGAPLESTPFYKYLLARAIAGQPEKPEAYSVGGLAARLGRFARPMGASGELTADFTYGFHIEERRYVEYLRPIAQQAGVKFVVGRVADCVRREDGRIAALRLEGGGTIEGDLFVDCAGSTSRLVARLDAEPRADWSAWLPCDRMLSGFTRPLSEPPSVTRIVANDIGWLFQVPLAESTYVGQVYASAFTTDEAAMDIAQRALGALQAPMFTRWAPGRRERFWIGNCVALGAAATELEPLAGAGLHLAQLGLAYLIELFPLDGSGAIEAAEYNRVMREYADSLRDFTLGHYRVGRRTGAFWDATRVAAPPASLAQKLDLYSASGRIDLRDHELFEELDWAWLLLGAGLVPAGLEWQIARVVGALRPEQAAGLRSAVERLTASMPRHIDFLTHMRAVPQRPGAA